MEKRLAGATGPLVRRVLDGLPLRETAVVAVGPEVARGVQAPAVGHAAQVPLTGAFILALASPVASAGAGVPVRPSPSLKVRAD